MICDIASTKEILEQSISRADKLMETQQVTKEGEVLSNTKELAEQVLKLLNERKFTELNRFSEEEMSSNITTAEGVKYLSDVFEAQVKPHKKAEGKYRKFTIKSIEHKFNNDLGDTITLKVVPNGGKKHHKYVFRANSRHSEYSESSKNILYIEDMPYVFYNMVNATKGIDIDSKRVAEATTASDQIKQLNKTLAKASIPEILGAASQDNTRKFKYRKNSRVANYKHGSVRDMQNMLADIHALGGKTVDNDTYKYYDSLLGSMHEHFFRKMNLFINKNEEATAGWVNLSKNHILLNLSTNPNESMSNTETYVHEVVHTMTSWALSSKTEEAEKLKSKLRYLKNKAVESVSWKDFVKADPSITKEEARSRYEYIFTSTSSDDEFLAYALTNPVFMDILKKVKIKRETGQGLFHAIKDFFIAVIDAFMGNYDFSSRNNNVYDDVHALAFKLGELNAKADKELEESPASKLYEMVDKAEGRFEEWAKKAIDMLPDKDTVDAVVPENMSDYQKAAFIGKSFIKATYNKNFRHMIGKYFTDVGVKPNSSVREIVRSILPKVNEDTTTPVEFAALKTNNIDLARNTYVANVSMEIVNSFDRQLSDEEQEALTIALLESNASVLFAKNKSKGYTKEQLFKLFSNKHYRDLLITKIERAITKSEPKRVNWIKGQAKGLGILMATGQGHVAQNSNSYNIVRGYLTSKRFVYDEVLEHQVASLAALHALNNQRPQVNNTVAALLKEERKGVNTIVNLYESFKAESKAELFKDDASHVIEGYTRELFPDGIETVYALVSEKEELEAQGFKMVSQYSSKDLSGAEDIGFFVSDTYTRPERQSGAVSLGNPTSKGMTLKTARYSQFSDSAKHAEVWFEADRARYNNDAIAINKQLEEGADPTSFIGESPVPVLDANGLAVDYRMMMSKKHKAKYLKQDRKVIDVLSKTAGTVVDKVKREEQNKQVLSILKKHIKTVYDNENSEDNLMEHTLISPESPNPEIRKLFHQLPKSFQQAALNRNDQGLPVPSILLDQYFGYSHMQASELPGIKNLPNAIKRILNMIEGFYMDIVKIVKGNILLKMPVVLVVNIVSNILYAVNTGINPLEIVKEYRESIKNVRNFMDAHTKYEKKRVELDILKQKQATTSFKTQEDIDKHNSNLVKLKSEMRVLEDIMNNNSVKELYELGMFQSVIENVNTYKIGDTNKVADSIDNALKFAPSIVKTPLQVLYLSKETKWYQANQYVLQMSDLVGRDVMNRKYKLIENKQINKTADLPLWYREKYNIKEKRVKLGKNEAKRFLEESARVRHTAVLNAFVNYTLPNGKGEEYLNRLGILMFTKYIKRIQNVITDTAVSHPIRSLLTVLAATTAADLETIQDQALINKVGDDYGLYGLTAVHSPVDILFKAVFPPLIPLVQSVVD